MVQIPNKPYLYVVKRKTKQGLRFTHVYSADGIDMVIDVLQSSMSDENYDRYVTEIIQKTYTWFKDPDPESGDGLIVIVRVGKAYLLFYESSDSNVYCINKKKEI